MSALTPSEGVHLWVAKADDDASLVALIGAAGSDGLRAVSAARSMGPMGFVGVMRTATESVPFAVENLAQLRDARRLIDAYAEGGTVNYTTFGVGPVAFCVVDGTELSSIIRELEQLDSDRSPRQIKAKSKSRPTLRIVK